MKGRFFCKILWPKSHCSLYSYVKGISGSGPTYVWMCGSQNLCYVDLERELWWQLSGTQGLRWIWLPLWAGVLPLGQETPVYFGIHTQTPGTFLKKTSSATVGTFHKPASLRNLNLWLFPKDSVQCSAPPNLKVMIQRTLSLYLWLHYLSTHDILPITKSFWLWIDIYLQEHSPCCCVSARLLHVCFWSC